MKRLLILVFLFVVSLSCAPRVGAHALSLARADALFRSNGTFRVALDFDVVALMAGVPPKELRDDEVRGFAELSAERLTRAYEDARTRMLAEIQVLTQDGTEIAPERIELPALDKVRAAIAESVAQNTQPSNFGAVITGEVPATTKEVRLTFPAVMGAMAVKVAVEGREPFDALHLPGENGPVHELGTITKGPPVSRGQTFLRYLVLGFEHIVPKGLDHILFVLGLFLLSTRIKPLLGQVTAFTLAHSITLGLAMYGVVSLPAKIVEPAIALSIAFVAIENICSPKLHRWRPVVVFLFGLLHGLGFAGVLTELGLPRDGFANALVAFNVGVEAGQLAVICGAALLVGWFFQKPWYRRFITIPASAAIALMGVWWTIERIFG